MFLLDSEQTGEAGEAGPLVFSASDLVIASECEYQSLYRLDVKLGRRPKPRFEDDAMAARAADLGDVHEQHVLAQLLEAHGPWDRKRGTGVRQIDKASPQMDRAGLERLADETTEALTLGADVVFQATFFDGEFLGFADFIVRDVDGRYAVWDSKLARHAKVTALLQLAAYGDQLERLGFEPSPVATLVLGNLQHSEHPMPDLLPAYRERRDRFRRLTATHRASGAPVGWAREDISACGRCDYCAEQVTAHDDLLLIGGMTTARRRKLIVAGITTMHQLAEQPAPAGEHPESALGRLREQARAQTGLLDFDGSAEAGDHPVSYRLQPAHTIGSLPPASDGDIFFDFEGDPLWQDPETGSWGIEYLFGVIEHDTGTPLFRPFWAHSRAGEKRAFLDFLAYVEERRRRWPDLHVYHYAAYEKSALRNLSTTHTAGEYTVDAWLREGLLVDLFDTVRHSLRISERSYSIKKLEPLYMGGNLRGGDVKDAGASVVAYAHYCAALETGRSGEAERILDSIADYNEYDCLSTLRLRDWLLGLAANRPAIPGSGSSESGTGNPGPAAPGPATGTATAVVPGTEAPPTAAYQPSEEELALQAYLELDTDFSALDDDARERARADHAAVAMVAAATGYHRREDKQFWWGHFDRLDSPVDDWSGTRNVFLVDSAEVLEDWATPPRARTQRRVLELTGTASDGTDLRAGSTWFRMYDAPVPEGADVALDPEGLPLPQARGGIFDTMLTAVETRGETTVLTVVEKSSGRIAPYPQTPMALTPGKPVMTASIRQALAELAREVGSGLAVPPPPAHDGGAPPVLRQAPTLPRHPGIDILRRRRPRLATLDGLPAVLPGTDGRGDYTSAITEAVADLDRSYLAVQGPPGTGKTHVGSHVIAALVARGWKIGVVGQSHAVVENMLTATITKAGLDPDRVGKKPKDPSVPHAWTVTDEKKFDALLGSAEGALIGGTAWTMTGRQVPAGSLDLLVIDEAGQFSLANTLAVSRAAGRLLLLGDPRQLPQVTQGTHPEPVDESALGWLSEGSATLPTDLGYFLADSWRMHPELCRKVSTLSYAGRLAAAPAASLRRLDGAAPGVETILVEHHGNATSSPEEADEVIAQVRRHLGLRWDDGGHSPVRPLGQEDVLVVAAYNAQVNLVRERLDAAGLAGVRVGTVDRFQGQEAPVVLVSMAVSAATEAPRGMDFLLNRNRINVAVSRGQWRAVLVRSPDLTNFLPSRPEGLAELGAFVGLCS
ncbi:TM0106 family RecB-like putative nuclease [Arthrobacter sp. JSM 101049]|uniref:TM0106 family RecB-like putative nuclease n=1 Tax=Arthrobacter sp. JSM 101049 TaxID=929097 RepID=UPI003569C07B